MLMVTESNIWTAVLSLGEDVWRQDGFSACEVAQRMGYVDEGAIKWGAGAVARRLKRMGFHKTSAPSNRGPSMRWVYNPRQTRFRRKDCMESQLRDLRRWAPLSPDEERAERDRFPEDLSTMLRTLPLSRLPALQEALDSPYDYRGDKNARCAVWERAEAAAEKYLRKKARLEQRRENLDRMLLKTEMELREAGWVPPGERKQQD